MKTGIAVCGLAYSCLAEPSSSSLDVRLDMETFLSKLAPEDDEVSVLKFDSFQESADCESFQYRHDAEGKDDMPAHVRLPSGCIYRSYARCTD